MAKSVIQTQQVQQDGVVFDEKDLVAVTIANHSLLNEAHFTWNNRQWILPVADATMKVPLVPFVIEDFGREFDAKIVFTQAEDVTVNFSKLKTC